MNGRGWPTCLVPRERSPDRQAHLKMVVCLLLALKSLEDACLVPCDVSLQKLTRTELHGRNWSVLTELGQKL